MELSPDLISACLALEKYLDNSNALTERELVRWGPGPGGPSFSSTQTQLLIQRPSLGAVGGCLSPGLGMGLGVPRMVA